MKNNILKMNLLQNTLKIFCKNVYNIGKCCIFVVQNNKNKVGYISTSYPNRAFLLPTYSVFPYLGKSGLSISERLRTLLHLPYGFLLFCSGNWVNRFFFYPTPPLFAKQWKRKKTTSKQAQSLPP